MLTANAQQMFEQNVSQNIWKSIIGFLRGSSQDLIIMPENFSSSTGSTCESQIPVDQIVGSFNPGRIRDFDGDFRPRHRRLAQRWISIAQEYLNGRSLPPVKLIAIDNNYFVLDGHHRISVARALGQYMIAAVIVK